MNIKRTLQNLTLIVFGGLLAIALLEGVLRIWGAIILEKQNATNKAALERNAEVTILCVGESTTAGESAPYGNYPAELERILNEMNLGVHFRVINGGLHGARSHHIIEALEHNLRTYDPHIIVSMMGINDLGQVYTYGSLLGDDTPSPIQDLRVFKLYKLLRTATLRRIGVDEYSIGHSMKRTRSVYADSPRKPRDSSDEPEVKAARARLTSAEAAHDEVGQIRELESLASLGDWGAPDMFLRMLRHYSAKNDTVKIEALYRQMIRRLDEVAFPDDRGLMALSSNYHIEFAKFLENQGRLEEAERIFVDLIENIDPGNQRLYRDIIEFYERVNDTVKADQWRAKRRQVIESYVNPSTVKHYNILKDTALSQGRILVAVQYPTRSLEILKTLTNNDSRLIYVDNEFFTELVAQNGYQRYFFDSFAVDFGHMTLEGNQILARRIAETLAHQLFRQDASAAH